VCLTGVLRLHRAGKLHGAGCEKGSKAGEELQAETARTEQVAHHLPAWKGYKGRAHAQSEL